MALTKVSAAMFSTAAQTSDLNLDDGTLFVDSSENRVAIGNTAPAEALDITGNLTLRSRGYLKLQDDAGGQFVALRAPATVSSSVTYTLPAADGSSGQTLSTNGSGTLSWANATAAGTGVTLSGTTISIGQAVATSSDVQFNSVKTTLIEYTDGDDAITIADGGHITAAGNVTVTGNLTVNGATVTNSATNTTIEDLLIELGTGTSGTPANDTGLVLERGSSDNIFIGWDESADVFTVGTGSFTGASTGNLTHTAANAVFGSITGTGLTIDTATLVVDASNNRVGIGNASPDVSLDIGSYTDAVHLPVGTTGQRPGSPAAGYFRYNSSTNQFEGYTDAWGTVGGGSTTLSTDLFTGNGSTVDFTISQAVDNENKLMVFIDGVYQNPDAYSMPANTTLRFSSAPANSRKIAVYSIAGVVSGTNINIDSFTGDGSDTTFTLSITPVNENNTLVYVAGVYQPKSAYSVSGTTLTFSSAPANSAAIEVATFNQTEINVPVDNSITTAKIVDDAVTSDKLASGLTLGGTTTFGSELLIPERLTHAGDTDTHLKFAGPNDIRIVAGGVDHVAFDGTIVFNQSGADMDFRVESTGNASMLHVDSGNNRVGIGTNSPGAPLNVTSAYSAGAITTALKLATVGGYNSNAGTALDFGSDQSNYATWITGRIAAPRTGANWGGSLVFSTNDNSAATAAVERLRISHEGNVGIGLNNPDDYHSAAEKLVVGGTGSHGLTIVSGTSNSGNIFFADGTTGNEAYRGYIQYQHSGDTLVLGALADDRVWITGDNHVGVGAAPNTNWRDDLTDDVLMLGTEATLHSDAGVTTELWNNAYVDNSDVFKNISTRGASRYFQYSGTHKWFTAASASAGSTITSEIQTTPKMTLDISGNLGIGTAPSSKLHVWEETSNTDTYSNIMRLESRSSGTTVAGFGGAIYFLGERNGDGALQAMGRIVSYAEVNSGTTLSSGMAFHTATAGVPTEKLRISHNGDVTTTGAAYNRANAGFTARKGDSVVITRASGTPLEVNRTGSDGTIQNFFNDGTIAGSIGVTGTDLWFSAGGYDEKMRIDADGNVGIGETNPAGLSRLHVTRPVRNSAFSPNNAQTWADVIVENPSGASTSATGIAFYNNDTYHDNAASGIAVVKHTASSDYGSDMVFILRPQSAVAEERAKLYSGGQMAVSAAGKSFGITDGNWLTIGRLYNAQGGPLTIEVNVGHNSYGTYHSFTNDTYAYNVSVDTVVSIGTTADGSGSSYGASLRKVKKVGGDYSSGDGGWEYQIQRNQAYSMTVFVRVIGALSSWIWTV